LDAGCAGGREGWKDQAFLDVLSNAQRLDAGAFNGLLKYLELRKLRLDTLERSIAVLLNDVVLPEPPEPPEAEERSQDAKPLVDSDWGYLGMVEAMRARKKYEDED